MADEKDRPMIDERALEAAARAIYDAPDTQSGDHVGTVIWMSEHLFYDDVDGEPVRDKAWRACQPVCMDAAQAAITAYLGALDGFVLVPVEPTEAMARIGGEYTAYASDRNMTLAAAEVWKAMIAARPQIEGGAQ